MISQFRRDRGGLIKANNKIQLKSPNNERLLPVSAIDQEKYLKNPNKIICALAK